MRAADASKGSCPAPVLLLEERGGEYKKKKGYGN